MSSDLHIAADKRFRHPRPASVVITQILIVISFVPVFLGLLYALITFGPATVLSIRELLFFSAGFGVVAVFLFFGFRGLKNGDRHGYWIGLVFLVLTVILAIYKISLTLKSSRVKGILDLAPQAVILLLLFALLLKFVLGKSERSFFSRYK